MCDFVEMNQKSELKTRIRNFKQEDAWKVSYLIRKTLIEVNSKDYPLEVIQFLCENNSPRRIIDKSSSQSIYVAVDDERILGTVSLQDDVILGLFVNPRFHGKSVGIKLMNHVETVARKKGYKSVSLLSSITAFEFYKKIGYKRVGDVNSKEHGRGIVMKRRLL